ncbi:MAG: hypothetical protein HDR00_02490 [Lachnospiraceae bacterium]|nr:hypothetical protein [Lachnospiraceae bacterium]
MKYSELITRQKKYKYSANICFDLKNDERLAGFIPNQTTTEILAEYLYGIIENVDSVHSRILYGSYGTGKSHLLTVLALILGHINTDGDGFEKFIESIKRYNLSLAEFVENYNVENKPYLVVPIYSDFESFDQCISYSLKKELANQGIDIHFDNYFSEAQSLIQTWESRDDSKARLEEVCSTQNIDLDYVKRLLNEFDSSVEPFFSEIFRGMSYGASFVSGFGNLIENINKANKAISDSRRGIVFIFDEFGRYLEDEGESLKVKSIQDLAELCDHGDFNNHIILVSHRQLSLYTDKMRKELSDEWKKIEGRFISTSINSKYDQCLSLIPSIIPKTNAWEEFSVQYAKELKEISEIAWRFKGFTLPDETEEDPFIGGFPLNPITLFSLDKLSKKVAQNERTFFTYLASEESNSLFEQLDSLDTKDFHFVGLDALFDYFEPNIMAYRSPEVSEAYKKYQMARNKIGGLEKNEIEHKLIKAMTVISIIGDTDTLSADENTLTYVIDEDNDEILSAIDCLLANKVIRLMRQFGYYDFLDGSIYDFDSIIEEQEKAVSDDAAINILNEEFRDFVVYPHKYNQKYHTNRILIPIFVKREELLKKSFKRMLPDYYDGILAFVFDSDYEEGFYRQVKSIPERSICVINWEPEELLFEVKRYIAIQYLYSKKDEYSEKDPTAENELMLYLEEQRTVVNKLVSRWRNLSLDKNVVYIGNELKNMKSVMELSNEASLLMETVFSETFIVNNDLINKNVVSGAIRQAREKALTLIIEEEDIIEACNKLSPEHSIIRAVLSKNGLCKEADITEADINAKTSKSADQILSKCIKKCVKAQRPLVEIYETLKNPPYGLRDGYIPVLLANELRKYENVSFYFHDIEKDYSVETLLDAINQPSEYTLYICNWNEKQKRFIDSLEKMFGEYNNITSKNRLKELYNAMNRHFTVIPKSARTTEKYVSERTKQYREIMSFSYKDYNLFFFEKLCVLGSDYDEVLNVVSNAKKELESVVDKQVISVSSVIKKTFGVKQDAPWAELKAQYLPRWEMKRQRLLDYQVSAVFGVIENETSEEDYIWINRVANAITGFEIEYWNDEKEAELANCLEKVKRQFEEAPENVEILENEIRLVWEGNGNQKIAQFDNTELSLMSQVMFNKMKTTLDNFGQSLSPEEKMQVLAKLLSEIM